MADERLSSQQWHDRMVAKYPGFMVMDPDGWDRSNFDESWAEEITFEEFKTRVSWSTCQWPYTLLNDMLDTEGNISV